MSRKTLVLISSGLAITALGVGGYFWQQQAQSQARMAEAVPPSRPYPGWANEFSQRVAALSQRVQQGNDTANALGELAALYHANGFLDEARRCYGGLEHSGHADAIALYRHAMILAGYGQNAPAADRFRAAADLAPDYAPARVRLGDLLLKENDFAGASAAYADALQRQPDHLHAMLGQARCAMEQGDWASARRLLETVVERSQFTLGYDLIVTTYEQIGMRQEAAEIKGRAKARGTYRDMDDPWMEQLQLQGYDPAQLALTAGVLKSRGDTGQARLLLGRALQFAPKDAKLHFQMALLCKEQKDFATAKTHLEQCTALDPGFPDGWVNLYDVLYSLGDATGAQRVFTEGLQRNPDSYGMNLMRARELRSAGKLRDAIPYFERVIAVRPTEPDAFIDLGMIYFSLGDTEAGLTQFRRALVAEPGNPTVLSALAFHAIQSGDADAAAQWLKRCGEQPRVSREELRQLIQLYQQRFPGR